MSERDVLDAVYDDLMDRSHTGPFLSAERYVKVTDILAVLRDLRAAATSAREEPIDPDYEQMRKDRGWPTPNHMRATASALDTLTAARYGDVLRWFADLADATLSRDTAEPEAASQPEAGLDEGRMAQALRWVDVLEGYAWEEQAPEGWRHRKLAADIVREYARLAPADGEKP